MIFSRIVVFTSHIYYIVGLYFQLVQCTCDICQYDVASHPLALKAELPLFLSLPYHDDTSHAYMEMNF